MFTKKSLRFVLILILISFFGTQPLAGVSAQSEETLVRITQVDNSQFPNVTVYVSATNAAGDPVGIDPETIQIQENGQVMQPVNFSGGGELVGGETIPVTTMLVIDISGSMDKNNKIGAAKEAAKAYVSGMRSGDQAGLITYDTQVYTVQSITSDTAALTAAIDGLQTGTDTAMYNALIVAEKALEGVSGRKAVIVLTDGMDNQSSSSADDVISGISESGLTITAIGFGDTSATGQEGLDETGLMSLAESAGGQYAFAPDAQTLSALYQQYGQSLQSEYAITYVSPSTLRDGINRNLTVSVAAIGAAAEGAYNPGGVLPEVTTSSLPLFASILVVLLLLLAAPFLVGLVGRTAQQAFSGAGASRSSSKSKGRIKLDRPPDTISEPRIKLK